MLLDLLSNNGEYGLALAPGFFRFYAHCGILNAFEELSIFNPSHVSGSSAGALVGTMIAAGLKPSIMADKLFALKRDDFWDAGSTVFGLLKGDLFKQKLASQLPEGINNFEDCKIPLGVCAWDIYGFKTVVMSKGNLLDGVFATCCVPIMFAPAMVNGRPYFDGGLFDDAGLMGLTGVPESNLIINVICDQSVLPSSVPPIRFPGCRLLTLVMENIPKVTPFSMQESGPLAFHAARLATLYAFTKGHIQQPTMNHWIVYIDGSLVDSDILQSSLKLHRLKYLSTFDNDITTTSSPPNTNVEEPTKDENNINCSNKVDDLTDLKSSSTSLSGIYVSSKIPSLKSFPFLEASLSRGQSQDYVSTSSSKKIRLNNDYEKESGQIVPPNGYRDQILSNINYDDEEADGDFMNNAPTLDDDTMETYIEFMKTLTSENVLNKMDEEILIHPITESNNQQMNKTTDMDESEHENKGDTINNQAESISISRKSIGEAIKLDTSKASKNIRYKKRNKQKGKKQKGNGIS